MSRLDRASASSLGVLLAAIALLAHAVPVVALEVSVGTPRERNGYVYIDAELTELFPPRVEESLLRGMPATVQVRAELWRRRNGWFDRLENSFDASVRIRYEVWSETFRLERAGADPRQLTGLPAVEVALSQSWALPAGRVATIKPGGRFYVVVYATLKPLSVEDVEEVEGWLSGEVKNESRAGLGVITELPRSLFDAVRNFAGFGDQRARAVSAEFDLRDLFRGHP